MNSVGKSKPHILVIPFPQSGHMLPTIDLIHQIALRGVIVTVVVTPKNLHYLNPLLSLHSSDSVKPLTLPFPPHASIPDGVENMSQLPVHAVVDMMEAFSGLYDPLTKWFSVQKDLNDPPQAIVADIFSVPWTNRLALATGIKSIAFLPITAHTLSVIWRQEDRGFFEELMQSTSKSWGLILNSFKELEADYVEDLKKNFTGHHRVWPVGPILPAEGGTDRGGRSSVPVEDVRAWLNTCPKNSVVYVAFGSQITMNKHQIEAIAAALEKSGVRFIWAVKAAQPAAENGSDQVNDGDLTLAGFEDRTVGKGLVIRGWAPQKVILEHLAVGTYLTHLGWGSALEGILGGTLLLGWPMHADNHFNVKLLVDELGAAIKVCDGLDAVPDSDELAKIFAESVREDSPQRAKLLKLRELGLCAVEEGGSSSNALDQLIKAVAS